MVEGDDGIGHPIDCRCEHHLILGVAQLRVLRRYPQLSPYGMSLCQSDVNEVGEDYLRRTDGERERCRNPLS